MGCCWIPDEVEWNGCEPWPEYEKRLYEVFRRDFLDARPVFNNLPVRVRIDPKYDEREEAFWHLTCRDYQHKDGTPESRDPDLERCKRIRWPRAFLELYSSCYGAADASEECRGVMVWTALHKTGKGRSKRVKLFQEDESYLVVLEQRKEYFQLITAFYVEEERSIKSIKRDAERNNAVFTALTPINAGSAC